MTRSTATLLGVCLLLAITTACSESAGSAPAADTASGGADSSLEKPTESGQQVAYTMGLNLGRNFKAQDIELDTAYLFRGIEDGLSGAESLMSDEEMNAAMQAFQQEMQARQMQRMQEMGQTNAAEGAEFLATNGERPEVTTLPSGLQYEVVQAGEGPQPSATSRVTVHYRGTLIDGTEFDNSYNRGQPITFRLDGVIPGWSEGLQLMNQGAIWKLYIPGELAYGLSPPPQSPIGPNATLVFVVELLSFEG